MDRKRKPGIYLLTDAGDAVELILVWLDGRETRLRGQSPAEELVSFVNFDFSAYRASVERLWEEHDVFEERVEVPYEDYVGFVRQALPLAEQLAETAPVAYRGVLHHLDSATKMLYNSKPIFPSRKALAVLNALRHPYFIQNRLRNLFEIGFADFERGTQQDRFRALEDTWPGLIDQAFPIRFLPEPSGTPVGTVREYALDDLYELCLAELSLYFQQDRRRIARCKNCWRYFVPKTEAESRYCYGEMDGKPCKQEGAKRMRRFRADTDEVLAAYEPSFRFMAEWWKQLYGESEGKENKGLFPASVEFTADLHSMGQYIQQGERHLLETVVRFDPEEQESTVPFDAADGDGLNFLAGRTMDFIRTQAMDGTLLAHEEGGVPNIILRCGALNADTLGQLIYFFEYACGLSGYLLDVNPFDQPGVEAYKKNMFALLGKPGYEDMGQALREKLGR